MANIAVTVYTSIMEDKFAVDEIDEDPAEVIDEGFIILTGDCITPSDAIDAWFDSMGDNESLMPIY